MKATYCVGLVLFALVFSDQGVALARVNAQLKTLVQERVIYQLHARDVGTRTQAARTLGTMRQFRPQRAVTALEDVMLEDRSPLVRKACAESLAGYGSRARHAIPALVKVSRDDPNTSVRTAAAHTLSRMGVRTRVPETLASRH